MVKPLVVEARIIASLLGSLRSQILISFGIFEQKQSRCAAGKVSVWFQQKPNFELSFHVGDVCQPVSRACFLSFRRFPFSKSFGDFCVFVFVLVVKRVGSKQQIPNFFGCLTSSFLPKRYGNCMWCSFWSFNCILNSNKVNVFGSNEK